MIRYLKYYLLMAVAALSSPWSNAVAEDLPDSMELIYKVSLGVAELGSLISTLERKGDAFEVIAETRAEGMASILLGGTVREFCRFSTDGNALTPESYRITREGKDAFDQSVSFNWDERRVIFSNGTNFVISDGYIVDNCSLPYAFIVGGAETFKGRSLHVVGGNKIRRFENLNISEDTVVTPIGEFQTVRIEQERYDRPDRKLTIWLAPDQHNLPVKIVEQRKSRPDTTMVLRSYEGL
ncbi:DUF3108 domain-containing protein [Pseudomonadota bacterium]